MFWLGVTGDRSIKLRGMGIVTSSMAVRVSASGFGVTNSLRGLPVEVNSFTDVNEAMAWSCKRVDRTFCIGSKAV